MLQLLQMLTDFAEIWWLVCNLTSQCWCRISLKSDVIFQSYGNVYSVTVFRGHSVVNSLLHIFHRMCQWKILNIGQYLAMIWTKVCGLLFWVTLYSPYSCRSNDADICSDVNEALTSWSMTKAKTGFASSQIVKKKKKKKFIFWHQATIGEK